MTDPSNRIHPTAILEGDIAMGSDNVIGPHAVLRGRITLGSRNIIGPGVVIDNRVRIGDGNRIFAHACIGGIGEMGLKGDRLPDGEGAVIIGDACTIREHVVIHAPVHTTRTEIGDSAYLMNHAYVAHDCVIGKRAVLSHGVALGGRCTVGEDAVLGMLVSVHQRIQVGKGAMVGMSAVVTRHVLPYAKVAGNPARLLGANLGAFERLGISEADGRRIVSFLADPADPGADLPGDDPVQALIAFMGQYPECILKRHGER
jgi:UDP-N-acetylglucosamine acyltransferase